MGDTSLKCPSLTGWKIKTDKTTRHLMCFNLFSLAVWSTAIMPHIGNCSFLIWLALNASTEQFSPSLPRASPCRCIPAWNARDNSEVALWEADCRECRATGLITMCRSGSCIPARRPCWHSRLKVRRGHGDGQNYSALFHLKFQTGLWES